tara:strand:- start:1892 stop:2395 length:504 start_codon:yes stop_codon:yes gene_type:complete
MKYILTLLLLFSFSSAWAVDCKYSPNTGNDLSKIKLWDNCNGTRIWANGNKYAGFWRYGQMSGWGTLTFPDGRIWEGQWQSGKLISGKKYAAGEKEWEEREKQREIELAKQRLEIEKQERKKAEQEKEKEIIKKREDFYNNAKLECEEIGFKKGTEAFGECVLDLTE